MVRLPGQRARGAGRVQPRDGARGGDPAGLRGTARWPRFAVAELHRTLALFSVAFLGLHIATAILDPYVSIGWAATVLPFTSAYRTLAIALGTLAIDLGVLPSC